MAMLCQGRVRLDSRKRLCPQRVTEHWDGLPRAAVTAPRGVWRALLGHGGTLAMALGRARGWARWCLWLPSGAFVSLQLSLLRLRHRCTLLPERAQTARQ